MATNRMVMQIEGADELRTKIATLSRAEEKRVFTSALRDANKLMLNFAVNEAKYQVGGAMGNAIANNIILRAFRKRHKYFVGNNVMSNPAWVEPSHKTGTPDVHDTSPIYITQSTGLRQYIPAAIEYGHVVRTGKTGGFTKKRREKIRINRQAGGTDAYKWVAPMPYMRTASKMSEQGRFRILAERLNKYIERIWTKRAKISADLASEHTLEMNEDLLRMGT